MILCGNEMNKNNKIKLYNFQNVIKLIMQRLNAIWYKLKIKLKSHHTLYFFCYIIFVFDVVETANYGQ
jgi:hypothetical protein